MATKLLHGTLVRCLNSNAVSNSINFCNVRWAATCEPPWVPADPETHTGQKWEKDDYRLARFVDRPKHVNTNFAIDLINAVPPNPREDRVVWCDGGGGPIGHPKVYINLDKPGNHSCGYCGLRFYKDDEHH